MFVCSQIGGKCETCTFVQALRLCAGRTAHRGSRGIALLFLDHGTRRGWGVSVTPRPLFTPRERPGTHCTGGWVGPRVGLDSCRKSRPHQDSIPDRPGRSQSLYRLSYRAPNRKKVTWNGIAAVQSVSSVLIPLVMEKYFAVKLRALLNAASSISVHVFLWCPRAVNSLLIRE